MSDSSNQPNRGVSEEAYQRTIAEMAELAGGLAHELRNPLSTVMINLKLLGEDLRDTEVAPEDMRRRALLKVDVLSRETERLQGLFDEFLRLAGPCRLQCENTDLRKVVAHLVDFFEPLARSKSINTVTAYSESDVTCHIDEKLIEQALLNIVLNAQDAMPDGGTLRISVGTEGADAVVAVTDTGVGIALDDAKHLMRPFFSTKAQGTGLGLSITRRIITEHGGDLEFDSELGRGTTFRIRLPLAK